MIVIRVVERPLDWIVYWTAKSFWEHPEGDPLFTCNGPILVSRADGSLFETGILPPVEDRILATEHLIQQQVARRV
jgi:hypothetical protein